MDYVFIDAIVREIKSWNDYNSDLTRNAFYHIKKRGPSMDFDYPFDINIYDQAVKNGDMVENNSQKLQDEIKNKYESDVEVRIFHLTEKGAQPIYFYLV